VKHAHPIIAAGYDVMLAASERVYLAAQRGRLLASARGTVLEIGAGTGHNFRHYPPAVSEVVAVEPDPYMRRRAAPRAASAPVPVRLAAATAEVLPVPDASVDAIVSTLVLCSVDDPDAAVAEWRRVLRTGGRVHLLEHVRSDAPWAARLQDLVTPVWRLMAANCHPNRSTIETIRRGGFDFRETERRAPGILGLQPFVAGIAVTR
jgi:ubiquinone/menaquinone biosynthesis C-methylase UbiE